MFAENHRVTQLLERPPTHKRQYCVSVAVANNYTRETRYRVRGGLKYMFRWVETEHGPILLRLQLLVSSGRRQVI